MANVGILRHESYVYILWHESNCWYSVALVALASQPTSPEMGTTGLDDGVQCNLSAPLSKHEHNKYALYAFTSSLENLSLGV